VTDDRNETLAEVIDERVQVYGEPTVTFPQIAKVWSGYLGVEVKPTDVPIMLLLMKTVRVRQAPEYSDNSDDIEGYLDIFRKLVGDDMIHARSVDEFIRLRKEKQGTKPTFMLVDEAPLSQHMFTRRPYSVDTWYCTGCPWTGAGERQLAQLSWQDHHALGGTSS
jgi:hypothetical protein